SVATCYEKTVTLLQKNGNWITLTPQGGACRYQENRRLGRRRLISMRKSLQKYRLKGAAALGAIALVMAGCASTENGNGNGEGDDTVYTRSYATSVGQGDHGSVANQAWMDLVTERTDGRVQFEAFWQEALCKTPELLDCTRDGRADITPVSP